MRCGIQKYDGKNYRLCQNHEKEKIMVRQEVPHKNEITTLSYKMVVQTGNGVDDKIKRPSRKKLQ